ncbi:immunity protein Imm33 domain-containing protein [Marinobacterium rhizophilum]|uniref:DUF2185 domain-containing protein n=1 Tax=Marinobacterium rhizophilum TaxID=420402 RepID=A0ABY5HQT8_9GAMM|nr:DUF2185 domain-containing protein [Marinobacterium rhizophilum]UTW13251.1 DUF2185 domain-containing protein [Marinobacterium rhizophilum]
MSDTTTPDSTADSASGNETGQTKSGFLALVSRMIFEEKLPVRFMYKSVPEHLNDTGWRLFSGYEDEAYLQDEVANLTPVPLEKLYGMDPTLEEKLAFNAGTVWERQPGSDWERVYDFRIPSPSVDVTITNDPEQFNG